DVSHRDRALLAQREVRDRELAGPLDRRQLLRAPLRHELVLAEPDEAADAAERAARLLDDRAEPGLELELAAEAAGDRRERPLALECLLELDGGPRALERDRR